MARRSRRSSVDTNVITSDPLASLLEVPVAMPEVSPVSPDYDLFSPRFDQRAFSFDAEVVRGTQSAGRTLLSGYQNPFSVQAVQNDSVRAGICARRHQRREVLHALRRVKRGRGGQRRRTWKTDVRC